MHARIVGIVLVGALSASYGDTEARTHPQDVPGFREYRVIFEKNMFKPRRGADQREERARQDQKSVAAAEPTDIKVVGIVKMDDSLSSIAIIEADGRHRLCRIGDVVGTMVVRDIRRDGIVFETPGGRWIAEIEPGATGRRSVMPQAERAIADAASTRRNRMSLARSRLRIKAAEIPHLVRSAGLVADARGGAGKGLRLTKNFMGLREGDRVTHVGRQSLGTDRPGQKLWQIARKYSGYGKDMPEIPIIVERGGLELEFVLCSS